MASLASTLTDDFSGGIYVGRKAPDDATYDLVNGLVNDEGLIYRRGGSEYRSTSDAASDLYRLHVLYMRAPAANRILARRTGSTSLIVLDGSNAPVVMPGDTDWSRPASVGDYAIFAVGPGQVLFYAGSQKAAAYSTGTLTATSGSTAVTGSGTSWSANVDPGMILNIGGTDFGVVKSVGSNTAITLTEPWGHSTAAASAYNLVRTQVVNLSLAYGGSTTNRTFVAAAGSGTPRLLFCFGNRVYFTPRGDPFTFDAADYHELPANVNIVGAEGIGDAVRIFTTAGEWRISNLSLDPIDAYGNIQHVVEQASKDLILWDDYGIAGFAGALVIPAVDDVFISGNDGSFEPVTGRVRPLYRDYVKAGYQPGQATVFRGHYFLPILNSTTLVDVLISRLDRGSAWTRFAGGAAGAAYATLIEETSRSPKLLGIKGARVTDLTGCFEPTESNATDADDSTSDFVLETRDYPTGQNQPGLAHKLRVRYEMEGVESTTTDTFERSDETPLASPYDNWITGGKPNLASGSAVDSGGFVSSTTRPETLGPNCTVEATLDAQAINDGATYYFLGARLTAHSNSANGYQLRLEPGTGSGFKATIRSTNAQTTIKTSTTTNYLDISGLRLVCAGNVLTGYLKVSGDWTEVVSTTDGTYTAAGFVGFGLSTFFGSPVGFETFTWTEGPSVTPAFSSDADDDVYAELTSRGGQNGTAGWGDSDGSEYSWADVDKRRERIRFRLTVAGATASFVLRGLELLTRPSGRQ